MLVVLVTVNLESYDLVSSSAFFSNKRIRTYEPRRSPREKDVDIFFRGDARESERSEEEDERVSPVTTGADDAPLVRKKVEDDK